MTQLTVRFVLVSLIIVAAGGAARAQEKTLSPQQAKARQERADLLDFGRRLEAAIKECNPLAIGGLLDRNALLDRITEGQKVPEPERTKFFASSAPAVGLGDVICKRITQGSTCHFVGISRIHGVFRAVMRFVAQGNRFDYYEFLLQGQGDDIRFFDVFQLSSGDMFTEHARELMSSDSTLTIYPYLHGHAEVPTGAVLARMSRLNDIGDQAAILRYYDTLSDELRHIKPVLMFALNAAGATQKFRFGELLDTLRSFYPNDPSLDLYLIQYFDQHEDYGSLLSAVDHVDGRVHDPWLNILRAKACMLAQRYSLAKRFADAAIAYDSSLTAPRWVLVVVALKERDFKQAVSLVRYISAYENVDAYIAELSKSSVGKEFIASKEFKEWRGGK